MTAWKKVVAAGLLVGLTQLAVVARAADAPPARVNLNTASATELARLPGIGAAKAAAIVEFRAKEPFGKPEDLRKVKGIGERLYQSLKDQITVGDGPSRAGRGG